MTTVTIDDELINEIIHISHYKNAQEAVAKILVDYLQRHKEDDDDLKIDTAMCLETFQKIKRGDRSGLTQIGDIDEYIENLKNL